MIWCDLVKLFFAGFTFFWTSNLKILKFIFFQIEGGLGALDVLECVRTWTKAHLREFGSIWSRLAKIEKGQTSTYSYFEIFQYLARVNLLPQKGYKSKFALRLKKPQIISDILTHESQSHNEGSNLRTF